MGNVLLYGAGNYCDKYLEGSCGEAERIKGIVDRNPDKWGSKKRGCEIMSPEILKSQEYDEVIVTVYAYETVIDYLLSQGISREKIFIYDAEEDGIVALVNVMPIIKQVKKSMLLESFLEDEYKEFNRVVIVGNDVDYGLVKDFFSVMQPDLKVVCEGEISEIHDNDKYIFAGKDYKEDIKKYRPKFKSEEQWIILPLYVVARDIRL